MVSTVDCLYLDMPIVGLATTLVILPLLSRFLMYSWRKQLTQPQVSLAIKLKDGAPNVMLVPSEQVPIERAK
ncbi:hypothetical protein BV22DRAFT_179952 [Leucogyrophana mollusca]|uniref:Uncharacterized protein n=1 Tax=Leucogyrophana mollusca TaxID=85980 RepID=A0ACB8BUN6_9AGAM|nr:hypothetical protein BV22DRAFT_179952 [Leucogyrophana mollusca]